MEDIKKECLRKALALKRNGWESGLKVVQKCLWSSYFPEAIDKALDALSRELPTATPTMMFYERLEMEQYLERERRAEIQISKQKGALDTQEIKNE